MLAAVAPLGRAGVFLLLVADGVEELHDSISELLPDP